MFEDEDRPRPKRQEIALGQALDGVSVGEMQARIAALQDEIRRLETEIARRQNHRAAADAFFKRRPESE
jgi:uncharacterized small protein (DUF1192 family)